MKNEKKNLENVNFKIKNYTKYVYLTFILLLTYPIFTSTAIADTNFIVNPSFESGSTVPMSWTLVSQNGNTPIWDIVSHSGSKSIQISISATTDTISGHPISDLIAVQPLANYTVSAWGKTNGAGGTNKPAVRVVELDENKNYLLQTNLPLFSMDTNDWTEKKMELKTRSDTRYIYVYANIWNGYGTFWVDDVTVSLKTSTSTPSGSWPNLKNKPFVGNWQWTNRAAQNAPIIVNGIDGNMIDVNIENSQASPSRISQGKSVVYGGWPRIPDQCDLNEVQARFALAKENKAYYEVANYLLSEETWGTTYGWGTTSCSETSGSATLGESGVTIQLKNTWMAANPGKTASDWSIYYQYTMLKAWKLHAASFGKKVSIGGFSGIPFSETQIRNSVFPSNAEYNTLDYVISNYDMIVGYQYPTNSGQIYNSVNFVKTLRTTFGYNGKITWLLTKDFGPGDMTYPFTSAFAYTEYQAVAPYVDYIISYDDITGKSGSSDTYPPILRGFYGKYDP